MALARPEEQRKRTMDVSGFHLMMLPCPLIPTCQPGNRRCNCLYPCPGNFEVASELTNLPFSPGLSSVTHPLSLPRQRVFQAPLVKRKSLDVRCLTEGSCCSAPASACSESRSQLPRQRHKPLLHL